MKRIRTDSNGIPILSRTDIEERVEKFIRYFDEECLNKPGFTPIATICTRLRNEHGVNFVFGQDLGKTKEGYKYRGRFHIPSQTIYIDKSLEEGGVQFNFTLAHELGHFVFHRRMDLSILKEENTEEISDTNRDLILDQIQGDNPKTWIEWQANKFASSLLLPRSTVPIAVEDKQKEMGINRNMGKIFLNRGHGSYNDYNVQMEHLSLIYQSSKSSIRIRLRELGILVDSAGETTNAPKEPAHLSKYLKNVVDAFLDGNG